MRDLFVPLRFPLHVLQITAHYVAQMSPSAFIINCANFQAGDEMRRIQRIAYATKALANAHDDRLAATATARDAWEKSAAWQPMRELLERLMTVQDWGEAFVALNLVVKPAVDALVDVELAALAADNGDEYLSLLLSEFGLDAQRSRAWSTALMTYAVTRDPAMVDVARGGSRPGLRAPTPPSRGWRRCSSRRPRPTTPAPSAPGCTPSGRSSWTPAGCEAPMTARVHAVRVAGSDVSFDVRHGERILTEARAAGHWMPYECGWGSCGTCKATLVEGETELLFPGAPALDPRDERRRRIILCQSTPTSDIVIKPTRVDSAPAPERPTVDVRGRLASVEPLSSDVSSFRFVPAYPVDFRPGQYAVLHLGPGLRRCYSMASVPGDPTLEFIAKRYPGGAGSTALFDLAPGAEVGLEVPYGDMWLRSSDRPIVLIAGGTGISAIQAMVTELAVGTHPERGRQVAVFYGATRLEDLVRRGELEAALGGLPAAELVTTLLEPPPGWSGTAGLVTDALSGRVAELLEADVYLAGPPPMVDAVTGLLRTIGAQRDRLHHDRFG